MADSPKRKEKLANDGKVSREGVRVALSELARWVLRWSTGSGKKVNGSRANLAAMR